MSWATAGVLTSPAAGTILADSGAQLASTIPFNILITTQYAARVLIAYRNSANNADNKTQLVKTVSDSPTMLTNIGGITLLLNERLVIRAESDMIGEVQASLIW